ncbi:MAG: amidohydrolase family protein, partial [Bacteroidota bacterium]
MDSRFQQFFIGFLFFALFSSNHLVAQTTYLHCGKLIDGTSETVFEKRTIVVRANQIERIEKGYTNVPAGAEAIDLKDYTVMPGLIDCHVHMETRIGKGSYMDRYVMNEADLAFRASQYAEITLMAGFTTVRDLGGSGVNTSLRDAIKRGWVKGPRIISAHKSIAITGGHADPTNGAKRGLLDYPGPESGVADGPDECRKAVRQQVKNGADVIKITATGGVLSVARDGKRPQFTEAEIEAIVETANDFGLKVTAHAHGDEGMARAVRGGVASIEHGTLMSENTMDLMIEKGTYYVPTITAGRSVADSAKIGGFFPALVTPKALEIGPKIQETFGKAYKRGVKIAFGTDAGVFEHGKNGLEFEYMVEAGMPPIETILSATKSASDLLDMDDQIGSIEAGKLADIVAVKGDPLEDIKLLQNIPFV